MEENNEDIRPILYLFAPTAEYVRPYFEKLIPEYRISDAPEGCSNAVMISSTDIYDVDHGQNCNELTPVDDNSPYVAEEARFADVCRANGIKPVVLRCAPIVCTGMQGFPRKMAEKIYRGTYIALRDAQGRRSVVHAESLPDAARAAIDKGGVYNVTDAVDPSINQLAEALAWRIAQKRIFYLKPKWYKLIFGKKKHAEAEKSLTFSCEKLRSTGTFNPVSTVDYLKTHIYDEHSL